MTLRVMMTAMLVCGLLLAAGCFNPPVERHYARKSMDAGDYADAERRLLAVLERDASDWEAHFLLGKTYLELNRPIQAQSELELALAINDESREWTPKILDALAQAMIKQGDDKRLYTFLDAQIDRYEGWQDYARKARYLSQIGDIDNAVLAYKQAAFFSRNENAQIYVDIADFHRERGNFEMEFQALKYAYYIDDERPDLPNRFRQLDKVPGPTTKEAPPQPEYIGPSLFNLPN